MLTFQVQFSHMLTLGHNNSADSVTLLRVHHIVCTNSNWEGARR